MAWLDDVADFAALQVDDRVRELYWSRGADDTQIALYRLGYINKTLPEADLPPGFLRWSSNGEKLVDSFVLPLTNALGEIKGFQFRSVDREVRGYMDYFSDETEAVLFGLGPAVDAMWGTGRAVLVEGAFDLFPLQRIAPDTVATLTARVAPQFARLLMRLVRQVFLSYDLDSAGRLGMSKFIRTYGKDFDEVTIIEYPQVTTVDGKVAKDPSEIWEAWGDDRLAEHLRCITHIRTEMSNAPKLF
jgi:DNA primase